MAEKCIPPIYVNIKGSNESYNSCRGREPIETDEIPDMNREDRVNVIRDDSNTVVAKQEYQRERLRWEVKTSGNTRVRI